MKLLFFSTFTAPAIVILSGALYLVNAQAPVAATAITAGTSLPTGTDSDTTLPTDTITLPTNTIL
jgi:hypothetical protein